jgi:putative SOS response-associated peptidase YedK
MILGSYPKDRAGASAMRRGRSPKLKSLLVPYPADEMTAWPASPRVGSVKNNDPSLIEPLAQTVH